MAVSIAPIHLRAPILGRIATRPYINRPKESDFDLPGSRERQRVVIRPLAGARGYRKVQSSKDVGLTRPVRHPFLLDMVATTLPEHVRATVAY